LPTSHNLNGNGILGGAYAGYNWQVNPHWLVGIEGDITALRRSASDTENMFETFTTPPAVTGTMTLGATNRWLASARGRVGWVGGPFMIYGTGGVAFTQTNYSALMTPGPANGVGLGTAGGITVPLATTFSQNNVGGVAGGGVEWMANSNWVFRAEYLYYWFPGASAVLPVSTTGPGGGTCVGCGWNLKSSNLGIQTVRVGVSYKFGGPVVAKY
jgi:outer membrane immunogenic protein